MSKARKQKSQTKEGHKREQSHVSTNIRLSNNVKQLAVEIANIAPL